MSPKEIARRLRAVRETCECGCRLSYLECVMGQCLSCGSLWGKIPPGDFIYESSL